MKTFWREANRICEVRNTGWAEWHIASSWESFIHDVLPPLPILGCVRLWTGFHMNSTFEYATRSGFPKFTHSCWQLRSFMHDVMSLRNVRIVILQLYKTLCVFCSCWCLWIFVCLIKGGTDCVWEQGVVGEEEIGRREAGSKEGASWSALFSVHHRFEIK